MWLLDGISNGFLKHLKSITACVSGIILGIGVAGATLAQPSRDPVREYPSPPIRVSERENELLLTISRSPISRLHDVPVF